MQLLKPQFWLGEWPIFGWPKVIGGAFGQAPVAWKFNGTSIVAAPSAPAAATYSLSGTQVAFDGGKYEVQNITTSTTTQLTKNAGDTVDLASYGTPGQKVKIRGIGLSGKSPNQTMPVLTITNSVAPSISIAGAVVSVAGYGTWSVAPDSYVAQKSFDGGATWSAWDMTPYTLSGGQKFKAQFSAVKAGYTSSAYVATNEVTYSLSITGAETWSGYSAGDNYTQLSANYTRSSANFVSNIIYDGSSPSGKALQIGTAAQYRMKANTFSASLASRTTEDVEVLVKLHLQDVSSGKNGIAFYNASGSAYAGFGIWRLAGGTTIYLNNAWTDFNVSTGATAVVTGISNTAVLWVRMRVSGTDIKARAWVDGGGEPGTWTTVTAGSAIPTPEFDIVSRVSLLSGVVLGYSYAIGGASAAAF